MASIGNKLASLVVDIVINTRRLQSTLSRSTQQVQNSANKMRTALTRVGLAASAFLLIRKGVDITLDSIIAVIEASARLEKQIIDIAKVAKFPDFDNFAKGFVELGQTLKGVSFAQLGEIGADLARLGLRGGSKSFLEFLEASASLSQVTGDIDLRQAGEGIGKILANFGKLGDQAGENALQLSVAINKLSDDFPVTAGEILNVTQKLSGFAKAVGLTQEQTLALTTLIKQTGISSTVVESSITRLLITLEKDPHKVAAALGKTGNEITEFANLVATDAFSAIKEFFDFLKKVDPSQAVQALVDLELATSRNAVAYLNAVAKIQDWDKALGAATTNAESMLAFFNKQNATMETMDARLINLKNSWDAFKASLGDATGFKTAIDALTGLLQSLINLENKIPKEFKTPGDILNEINRLREVQRSVGSRGSDFLTPYKTPFGFGGGLLFALASQHGEKRAIGNKIVELQKQYDKLLEQLAEDAKKQTEEIAEQEKKIKAQNEARKADFDATIEKFGADTGDDPFAELNEKITKLKKEFPEFVNTDKFKSKIAEARRHIQDKLDEKANEIRRQVEEDTANIHFDKFKEFSNSFDDVNKLLEDASKITSADLQQKSDQFFKAVKDLRIAAFDLSISPEDFRNKIKAIDAAQFVKKFKINVEQALRDTLATDLTDTVLGGFSVPSLDKIKGISTFFDKIPASVSRLGGKDFILDTLFGGSKERKFSGLTEAWKEAQTKSTATKEQIELLKLILDENKINTDVLRKIEEKVGLPQGALK